MKVYPSPYVLFTGFHGTHRDVPPGVGDPLDPWRRTSTLSKLVGVCLQDGTPTGNTVLAADKAAPCLYVALVENITDRVPFFPLFLAGNSTPTVPHCYSKRKDSGFPMGCADSAVVDARRGSNVYEVNPWLWQFGRGKPRLGRLNALDERLQRGLPVDTRRQLKAKGT